MEELSNCCGAPIIYTDICSDCKEHCEPEENIPTDNYSDEARKLGRFFCGYSVKRLQDDECMNKNQPEICCSNNVACKHKDNADYVLENYIKKGNKNASK